MPKKQSVEIDLPETRLVYVRTIRYVQRYFPETNRRTAHNTLSRDGSIHGEPIAAGVIIGRELHNTLEELEDWRSRLMRRLLSQLQDQGRREPNRDLHVAKRDRAT